MIVNCDLKNCVLVIEPVEVAASDGLKFASSSEAVQPGESAGGGVGSVGAMEAHGPISEQQGEGDERVSSIQ